MDDKYFYVKSSEDHFDLADLFGGVYLKERGEWRFDLQMKQNVLDFLSCSSSEDEQDLEEYLDKNALKQSNEDLTIKEKKSVNKDRLHRANSFNASDMSDESDSSLDEKFRRHRKIKTTEIKRLKKHLKRLQKTCE